MSKSHDGLKDLPGDHGFWLLGADPRRYRISDALQELQEDWWTVGRSRPVPGDKVLIWKFKGGDEHRGVVGLGEILSAPKVRSDHENRYWIDRAAAQALRARALVRYFRAPNLPLWLDTYPELLGNLSVVRATGGAIFKVAAEQWDAVASEAGYDHNRG